jgi:hypothetical protein
MPWMQDYNTQRINTKPSMSKMKKRIERRSKYLSIKALIGSPKK